MNDFGSAAYTSVDVEHVLWIPDATPEVHVLIVSGCLDPSNLFVAFGLLWEHGTKMPYIVVPPYRLKDMWGWGIEDDNFKPLPCDQWSGTFRGTFAGCPVHCLLELYRDTTVVFDPEDKHNPDKTAKIVVC